MAASSRSRRTQHTSTLHVDRRQNRLKVERLESRYVLNAAPVLDPSATPELLPVFEDAGAPVGQVGTLVSALIDSGGPLDNFSDADGDSPGIAITGVNLQGGTLWYSVNGGVTWADVGVVSDADPKLLAANAVSRVYFQAAEDFSGAIDDVISFKAWDQYAILQQLGSDIDGEAEHDASGYSVSLSADGQTVAIGAIYNDGKGGNSGHVRVYRWLGWGWLQQGSDIDGEAGWDWSGSSSDFSGRSVSLSANGQTVAIGAPYNDGNGSNSGHVRIYGWSGTEWVQQGSDIDGEAADDNSGTSVSLSADGQTVAIGAPQNTFRSGHVRIFHWDGTAWVQHGSDIDGKEIADYSGTSVSLSADGQTVAVGAPDNDGNGSSSGHVRIFRWDGTAWVQQGSDIDGEGRNDWSGSSVSLSADGQSVAIGAPHNQENGSNAGHVRIFRWDGTAWVQQGSDIDGEAADDNSGTSVSLSADGQTVAIGALANDGTWGYGSSSGHVRIFRWDGTAWVQQGSDIDGEGRNDWSGSSVSLSADGQSVAIGAPNNGGNGGSSGHVRIYRWNPVETSFSLATDTVSVRVDAVASVPAGETRTDDNTYSGDTTLIKTGAGTLILNKANTHTGGLRVDEGTVKLQHVNALNSGPLVIKAGAKVVVDTGTSMISLSSLSLDPSGQLDVGTAGITVAAGGFVEAEIRQLLVSGCNNGAWDGAAGIVHGSTESGRAIGYKVDANGVLTIRQTMAGDANLDGKVDFDDILALFPNYGTTSGMVWSGGDITYDDKVDFDDILALFPNYGGGSAFSNSVGGGGGTGTFAGMGGGGTGTSTGVSGGDSASTAPSGDATTTAPVMGPAPPAELGQQTTVTLTRGSGSSTSSLDATSLAFAALDEQGGVSKKTDDGGVDPGLSLGL